MRRFRSHSTVIQDTLKIGKKYSIVPLARDEGVSERARERASERVNERSGAWAKRAVCSKRVSEQCERMRERMSEWLITNVPILRGSESQCILPIVRPKRVSRAAMTTDSETHAHTRTYTHTLIHTHTHTYTHKRAAEIKELAEPQRRGIATHTRTHKRTRSRSRTYTLTCTNAPPELIR